MKPLKQRIAEYRLDRLKLYAVNVTELVKSLEEMDYEDWQGERRPSYEEMLVCVEETVGITPFSYKEALSLEPEARPIASIQDLPAKKTKTAKARRKSK